MVVFRHLMGTVYRRALVGQLDKLLDERVLLGTGISSQEMLRCVPLLLLLTFQVTDLLQFQSPSI